MKQELIQPLLEWYELYHRDLPWRKDQDAYHVWVSEIMLQQTRVEAVKGYYERFLAVCPTLKDLANTSDEQLHKLWEGLGYYSRVRNMKRCALQCMEKYDGELPKTYQELLTCAGIGTYSAGAIASIAYEEQVCAVDGNVMRVFSRILGDESDIALPKTKKHFEEIVAQYVPRVHPGVFNQAIMELGALVCVPNGKPDCMHCPVACYCEAHLQNKTDVLPVKSKKKKRKIEDKTVFIYLSQGKVHLSQRSNTGLLASLFEFDVVDGKLDEKQVKKQVADFPVMSIMNAGEAKHIFTHIEWHMRGYLVLLEEPSLDGVWASLEELENKYAIPTAYQRYKECATIWLKNIQP